MREYQYATCKVCAVPGVRTEECPNLPEHNRILRVKSKLKIMKKSSMLYTRQFESKKLASKIQEELDNIRKTQNRISNKELMFKRKKKICEN